MFTLLLFTFVLVFSLWLILRACAYLQNNAQNAALLAQLEAMDADLTRLEIDSQNTDQELRKLVRSQRPKRPKPEPTKPPTRPEAIEEQSTLPQSTATSTPPPSASPRETENPNSKRQRGVKPTLPKSVEEYEATRKRLPPSPVYIPNPKAAERVSELYNIPPQSASANIGAHSRPLAVEDSTKRTRTLLNLCLSPIRIATRFFSFVLLAHKVIANFFARPKPPPIAPESVAQNRAA